MGRKQVRCHGDERRFEIIASFVYEVFGTSIKYIADVAGGQGLLSRILTKKYNYVCEVIDPREYILKGVKSQCCEYTVQQAKYYDLIIGLHPDEATKAIVESALYRPVLIVPCCNFWDLNTRLGSKALIDSICCYLKDNNIDYQVVQFDFKGPKNVGIVTRPHKLYNNKEFL